MARLEDRKGPVKEPPVQAIFDEAETEDTGREDAHGPAETEIHQANAFPQQESADADVRCKSQPTVDPR